ncbi:MAG: 30S ribosomal protein S19e [Halobacteriota archaeon]
MVTIYDVPADELISELADRLAERLETPEWANYTKSGSDRELPPKQEDFWETRAASVLRKVAMNEPIGIERLATEYGGSTKGSNRYTVAPPSHTGGSKKIIRTVLAQLEAEGFVRTAKGEGRHVTDEGRAFLDEAAADVFESLDRPELQRYA